MRYLLDTSALLAHHRGEPGSETIQAMLEDASATILLASVTLAEFARRLHALGADDSEVQADLSAYESLADEIVAIDAEIAQLAYALGRATPVRLPLIDALIAAAAKRAGATLVHRDPHFDAIPAGHLERFGFGAASRS